MLSASIRENLNELHKALHGIGVTDAHAHLLIDWIEHDLSDLRRLLVMAIGWAFVAGVALGLGAGHVLSWRMLA